MHQRLPPPLIYISSGIIEYSEHRNDAIGCTAGAFDIGSCARILCMLKPTPQHSVIFFAHLANVSKITGDAIISHAL